MRVDRPYTAEQAVPSTELSPRAATSHGVRLPPASDDDAKPPPRGQARRGSLGLGLLRARQQARQAALAAKFQENVTPTPVEVGDQREHVRMLLQAIDSGNTIALPEIDAGAMTPAAKQGKAASRRIGDAASSASNISRAYLAGVLQPRREFDETPRWKEEIVERVRRRTAGGSLTERAQLKTAAATPRRHGRRKWRLAAGGAPCIGTALRREEVLLGLAHGGLNGHHRDVGGAGLSRGVLLCVQAPRATGEGSVISNLKNARCQKRNGDALRRLAQLRVARSRPWRTAPTSS